MNTHSYDLYKKMEGTSEYAHLQEINHFTTKFSREVFKKTPAEKQELKTRMYAYPSKHGAPVPPNN